MSWHDKSRAVSNDIISSLPEEYFCLSDGDALQGASFDKDDITRKTTELGAHWEFASYARAGLASPGKGAPKTYHYTFPETLYVVFSVDHGEIDGNYTSYDMANTKAVEAGETFRFVPYFRYDMVTMRTFSENEKQDRADKQMGYFNISGDKLKPIDRMSPETFKEYKADTDRPESLLA